MKIDPYVNVDAGTMAPKEHGETFVLDDGGECDLDLGNYERFLDVALTKRSNLTTGKILKHVINRERRGAYKGEKVQMVPHLTDAVQDWIVEVAKQPVDASNRVPDICVIELGGTVGDIESMPFIEALRQLKMRGGEDNFCSVFLSMVVVQAGSKEQKTKPTQHGVKELRSLGLAPDIVVCRSNDALFAETKKKLSLFCQVPASNVVSNYNVPNANFYRIPCVLQEAGVANMLISKLKLVWKRPVRMKQWTAIADRFDAATEDVHIAVVSKYYDGDEEGIEDAYMSVIKALEHASLAVERKLNIDWVYAEHLAPEADAETEPAKYQTEQENCKTAMTMLEQAAGILVPGGFGLRAVEGKIVAAKYAREHNKPYLGICLGFQCMAIEFARTFCGLEDAHSTEFKPETSNPIVIKMPEGDASRMGGTMRLGKRITIFQSACLSKQLYGNQETVSERHRHRYEVNPEYVDRLEDAGLEFVGQNQDETGKRMEIAELKGHANADGTGHPFMMGVQYHPEFQSRPGRPSPPFLGLLLASTGQLAQWRTDPAPFKLQDPWANLRASA